MINLGPLQPPVNTPKVKTRPSGDAAAAGTEINKDTQRTQQKLPQKRRGKDRRQRSMKPLINIRSGRDRREDPQKPSVNIKI